MGNLGNVYGVILRWRDVVHIVSGRVPHQSRVREFILDLARSVTPGPEINTGTLSS